MTYFIFFIAFAYSYICNEHFGRNWLPQTPEEAIADGIFALIFSLGCLVYIIEKYIKSKEEISE